MEANKKRAKVHMLPTEESIIHTTHGDKQLLTLHEEPYKGIEGDCTPQHLYITTDEEIKPFENCWVFDSEDKSVFYNGRKENAKGLTHTNFFHKIIATTDPKLTIESPAITANPELAKKEGWEHYKLPQPSQEFVKAYCEQGGFDEVDVEYETIHADRAPNGFETLLKVDPIRNTITTHRIKDSWSREEVPQLIVNVLNHLNIKDSWSREEVPQLIVNVLNHLNENQAKIDEDADLLEYVKNYIK